MVESLGPGAPTGCTTLVRSSMPWSPLPEMRLSAIVVPDTFPVTEMPPSAFASAACPAILVPIRFPWIVIPVTPVPTSADSLIEMPTPPLPEITLPSDRAGPPIVTLSALGSTEMPSPPFASAAAPFGLVPIRFPVTTPPVEKTRRPPESLPEMTLFRAVPFELLRLSPVSLPSPAAPASLVPRKLSSTVPPVAVTTTPVPNPYIESESTFEPPPSRRPKPRLLGLPLRAISSVPSVEPSTVTTWVMSGRSVAGAITCGPAPGMSNSIRSTVGLVLPPAHSPTAAPEAVFVFAAVIASRITHVPSLAAVSPMAFTVIVAAGAEAASVAVATAAIPAPTALLASRDTSPTLTASGRPGVANLLRCRAGPPRSVGSSRCRGPGPAPSPRPWLGRGRAGRPPERTAPSEPRA